MWMLPDSDAKYANHSCTPNATIDDDQYLVAVCDIEEGQEVVFVYNIGEETDEWDDAWTFTCLCGSKNCQGIIDRYRPAVKN